MNRRPDESAVLDAADRDRGAVLPLVLVMMVLSALVVIPLLSYSVSVLKANTVVANTTRDREAAEAGVRVALLDPNDLFSECDAGSTAVPAPFRVIDEVDVTTRCELVEEVGPLNVMGFQTPVGSTATQLGATLPATLTGTRSTSPAVPPYPTDERWWTATETATSGSTWMPPLPTLPATTRTATPYAMPASYDCSVFLPGHYTAPITISSGNVYFASGVYYFESDLIISGDATVIVGYGLAGFDHSDCADDVQVSANLLGNPGTFDIDGDGATFVFGGAGNFVVDNATTITGLSVRFNQRYAEVDRGGRVSIMSVNGDDITAIDHVVDDVVSVPRSRVMVDETTVALGENGATYTVSSPRFTSKERLPEAPADLTLTPFTTPTGAPNNGAVFVTWAEVTGQAAGGAVIDEYRVTSGGGRTVVCAHAVIISPAPGTLGCLVTGLSTGQNATLYVQAHNSAGWSPEASGVVQPTTTSPLMAAPDAPTGVTVTPYDQAATVGWTPAVDHGAPVTTYTVTAERVYLVAQTPPPADDDDDDDDDDDEDAEVLPPVETYEAVATCTTTASALEAAAVQCTFASLPDLAPIDDAGNVNVGYRFVVTATNAMGTSVPAIHVPTPAVLAFDGDPVPAAVPPAVRYVEPWIPEPIVDLRVAKNVPTAVAVPGYVSVPMGRIELVNTNGQDVKINGGILTSTMVVDDKRAAGPESLPIGYRSDIVLQRKIKIVAVAGRTTVTAYVQVNENGDYKVNSWVVS
jgi:Tfp pilus assembly protein PilX